MKDKLFTRNFTFLILGQVSSLIGNYTLKFALSMYVLEQTGSASIFATLLAIAMLPTILLSPFGGILADRANRRNIMVSAISFIVALLGVVGFPEICKSFSYQMWELEQSCKYNLRQLIAIKLTIIGTLDLLIILAITFFTCLQTELPMWEMALYLFVPFNLACIASFFVTTRARNKNTVLPIFPAGFGVAFLMLLCINRFSLYQSISIPLWLILCLCTFTILIWKATQFIKGMDEGGLAICN